MADVNLKTAKMANQLPAKSIDKAGYSKIKLEGRGVIAPTQPPTAAGETPSNTPPVLELKNEPGRNFFLLAALGVGAYFAFKK